MPWRCGLCAGSGQIQNLITEDWKKCPACDGVGEWPDEEMDAEAEYDAAVKRELAGDKP